MKLESDGRKRLEAMRKALAAGLPLVGLLAAACSKDPQGGASSQQQRDWRYLGEREVERSEPILDDAYIPMGEIVADNSDGICPPDIDIDTIEELQIATDVSTLGILLPPGALQPPEDGGEVDWHSNDDVVVRVEDADSEEADDVEEESRP